MLTIAIVCAVAALSCVLAAAVSDIMRFEIPDGLSIALAALAIVYGFATPGFDWLSHVGAAVLVFGVGLFTFARGWMGGGDVKLLTAIAAWTGLHDMLLQLTATALSGGVLALVLIAARAGVAVARPGADTTSRLLRKDAPLPYAVAIAAGTFWWALQAWPLS